MTSKIECHWKSETNGCETRPTQECNRCGEVLCSYHFETQAHVVYGCKCKICGKKNWDGCEHGIPTWKGLEA